MAPSRYDWKIVDWDVKPQHNQPTNFDSFYVERNKTRDQHLETGTKIRDQILLAENV